MAVVYAVQNPHWRNPRTKIYEPKYDLSSCEEYGKVSFILDPNTRTEDPDSVVRACADRMETFCEDDFVLLIGNPVLIALVAIEASEHADVLTFLQWDGRKQSYTPITADLRI